MVDAARTLSIRTKLLLLPAVFCAGLVALQGNQLLPGQPGA